MNLSFGSYKRLFAILIAGLAFFLFMRWHFFSYGQPVLFEIEDGSGGAQIAANLQKAGVIKSPAYFRLILKISRKAKKLVPGRYAMRKNMSSEEALWTLLNSDGKYYIRVLIPEGWRMEQVADRLQAQGITDAKEFLRLAQEKKLEGYLFPSTYLFERKTPPEKVLAAMRREFDHQIRPLLSGALPDNLNELQVLTVASIVEREAMNPSERPLIAGVYLNRFAKGMALEADPTVQYALGYWKDRLLYEDLKVDSPYNTYRYGGLPPGPICSPGRQSVAAVLSPAKIDALYFVADREGGHVFNAKYNEHLKAKRRMEKKPWNQKPKS
ncbi:MAG TPA: endolytic transglycosylase MltG [Elusimicrobiales bacterium]|nr:endolytic transglycosylase MltG [Elusimicrobiales bacterium]